MSKYKEQRRWCMTWDRLPVSSEKAPKYWQKLVSIQSISWWRVSGRARNKDVLSDRPSAVTWAIFQQFSGSMKHAGICTTVQHWPGDCLIANRSITFHCPHDKARWDQWSENRTSLYNCRLQLTYMTRLRYAVSSVPAQKLTVTYFGQ